VNDTPALASPLTVTTTLPVVAPAGTGAAIEVALQLTGVAAVPLNVTVLVRWVEPKLLPAMVTDVPTAPELGDKSLMLGTASTEVALQLVGLALVALKKTRCLDNRERHAIAGLPAHGNHDFPSGCTRRYTCQDRGRSPN